MAPELNIDKSRSYRNSQGFLSYPTMLLPSRKRPLVHSEEPISEWTQETFLPVTDDYCQDYESIHLLNRAK